MKNRYWIAKDGNEKRYIIGLLASNLGYTCQPTAAWRTEMEYPIVFVNTENMIECVMEGINLFDRTQATVEELEAWAKSGFEEPKWRPKVGQDYFVPTPHYIEKYTKVQWKDDWYDNQMYILDIVCPTPGSAIELADIMLEVVKNKGGNTGE